MSKCKDCFHYDVCSGFTPTDLDADVFDYCREGRADEIPDIEKRCNGFKHKADVVEVRHGKWVPHEFEQHNGYDGCRQESYCYLKPTCYRCSLCGRIEEYQEPYCNCGAKMDGKDGAE